jgi:hypothetical protein
MTKNKKILTFGPLLLFLIGTAVLWIPLPDLGPLFYHPSPYFFVSIALGLIATVSVKGRYKALPIAAVARSVLSILFMYSFSQGITGQGGWFF